jgi:oligo-1,6-glucosidase
MPTLNEYQHQKDIGGNIPAFMAQIKFSCRDNGRTPFQWDATPNAGFTTGNPWIKVNPNYITINAAAQEKDVNSCLNYFRKMIKLRKENKALIYGKYTLLDKTNEDVYAYTREQDGKKFLVLLNFKNKMGKANTGINVANAKRILGNYSNSANDGSLQPYEAIIYELN